MVFGLQKDNSKITKCPPPAEGELTPRSSRACGGAAVRLGGSALSGIRLGVGRVREGKMRIIEVEGCAGCPYHFAGKGMCKRTMERLDD